MTLAQAIRQPSPNPQTLSTLLELEGAARKAHTVKELQFLIANETRRLLNYRQAFVVRQSPHNHHASVEAASGVSLVERRAPLIRWVEQVIAGDGPAQDARKPVRLDETQGQDSLRKEWKRLSPPQVLWCPLCPPHGSPLGGLWLARDQPWLDADMTIAQRLAEAYAHAWAALERTAARSHTKWRLGRWLPWGLAALAAALCLPVRLSALAPVEVIAKDPVVVSAPMDGVIGDILALPNRTVTEGQTLFRYDDTNFRNQYEVAEKQLAVALAEHRKASQASFKDPESKGKVPLLEEEARLREAERDYARELLSQVDVNAAQPGLLLYSDKSDWIGRPVKVGERIMEIADPSRLEFRITLPVGDAMMLREGAEVQVFLDARPLQPVPATLINASYHAEVVPGDLLAYRLTAQLARPVEELRIGWRGTAKVYGERSTVFLLLFRRPLSAARQYIGL